jgi:hypothetical protein
MSDGLFRQPRRKIGPLEAALGHTLAAWADAGTLAGNAYAADRAALRDLARAADMAREDAYGDGSPWVLAQTARAFREALVSYRGGGESHDGIDALIASISAPPVRDTPQP